MKPKRALITQSDYIPWKGYFQAINQVDELILLDDVQYTRRDWRNRNRIKTPDGLKWLTIPVQVKGRYSQMISETLVADQRWRSKHFETLRHCYSRAPHFGCYQALLEELYFEERSQFLSEINHSFVSAICDLLGIQTAIRRSSEFDLPPGKNQRLIAICQHSEITDYYTGRAARAYLDEKRFSASGINVHWLEYGGYREYPQLHGPFEHAVSVLDLLFMMGPEAPEYIWGAHNGGGD